MPLKVHRENITRFEHNEIQGSSIKNVKAKIGIAASLITILTGTVYFADLIHSNHILKKENEAIKIENKELKKQTTAPKPEQESIGRGIEKVHAQSAETQTKPRHPAISTVHTQINSDAGLRVTSNEKEEEQAKPAPREIKKEPLKIGILQIDGPPFLTLDILVDDVMYGEQTSIALSQGPHKLKIISERGLYEKTVAIADTVTLSISAYDFKTP